MCEFKVGDVLIGNKSNRYSITNKTNRCMVIRTGNLFWNDTYHNSDDDMEVIMIEGFKKGCWYIVNSNYFNKVESPKELTDKKL